MTYLHEFKRADGTEILIEYKYSEGSGDSFYGGRWMPGDDSEIEYVSMTDENEKEVELTEAEIDKIEEEIYANPPEYDPSPDDVF